MEAQQFVWKGSIPLQIHLHESEVHFRGYPGNVLIPCEGEDSVKWSFINSLKEAAYIINGNCKNVMNMSQTDQLELWRSVSEGDLEAYRQVSTKLKLGLVEDEYSPNNNSVSLKPRACIAETELGGQARTVRIPVRLYVWSVTEDFEGLEDAPQLDSWDKISYINRPVEIVKEDGKCFTLAEAIKTLLPELFCTTDLKMEEGSKVVSEGESSGSSEHTGVSGEDIGRTASGSMDAQSLGNLAEMKFVRIQGIDPRLEIPFSWVANNLMFPEYFLHICICLRVAKENGQ